MTAQDLIDKGYENIVIFDNPSFDNCIIGISTDNVAIYSYSKMIDWFSRTNNCTAEEALEFIEFNTLKSLPYIKNSPIVMDDIGD